MSKQRHKYVVQHQPELPQSMTYRMTFYETNLSHKHGTSVSGSFDVAEGTLSIQCVCWGDFDHSSDGECEMYYDFDKKNTARFCAVMHQHRPFLFLSAIKSTLVAPSPSHCLRSIIDFCDQHRILYDYYAY